MMKETCIACKLSNLESCVVPQLSLGISVVPTNILRMTRNTAEGAWTIAGEFACSHLWENCG